MYHLIEPLPIPEPSQVLMQLSDDMKRMSAEISGNDEWIKAAASIDGTGWAEAAFCDDVDPAQRNRFGAALDMIQREREAAPPLHNGFRRANLWLKPIVGDGIGLTTIANPGWPDDHLVTDEMRGQGE